PTVSISNYLQVSDTELLVSDLLQADFLNCIIYGSENREFLLRKEESAAFNFYFENSLLRFNDFDGSYEGNALYDFSNAQLYSGTVLNGDPVFMDTDRNMLVIGEDSAAESIGNQNTANDVPQDILGVNRTNNPDAGAYQSIVFPED